MADLPADAGDDAMAALSSLAARLAAYAGTLTPAEQAALTAIVVRAMDPVERWRLRDVGEVLDEREAAILHAALSDREDGTRWDTPA